MVFQQTATDDWMEMTRLCLGLLIKCSHHPNSDVVAMATAKLHSLLQSRASQDPKELGYLLFSINKALNSAIDGKRLTYSTYLIYCLYLSNLGAFIPPSYSWTFRTIFVFDADFEGVIRKVSRNTQFEYKCTRFTSYLVRSRFFQ